MDNRNALCGLRMWWGGYLLVTKKDLSVPVHMSGEQSERFGVGVM